MIDEAELNDQTDDNAEAAATMTLTHQEFLALCGSVDACDSEPSARFSNPTAADVAACLCDDIEALAVTGSEAPEVLDAVYRRARQARTALRVVSRNQRQARRP